MTITAPSPRRLSPRRLATCAALGGTVLALALAGASAAGPISFTSSLVRTTDLAAITPASPDPSGLTYLPSRNTLLLTDGEVEETVNGITQFAGSNTWELTLGGAVVRTSNISKVAPLGAPITNEPTGVAWDPASGHYFVTDDDAQRVYDIDPGIDGLLGTSDDSSTFFSTVVAGNLDPEGVTVDTQSGHLFVSDGVNREIFEYTTTGSFVHSFDVSGYGVDDPESVEYNAEAGTLLVLSNHFSPIIAETSTSGALYRTIDVSAAGAYAPAGLAYAPASGQPGAKSFYIVDRAIDNNTNPSLVDGKLFELTAPPTAAPVSAAPAFDAGPDLSIALPAAATLDATVTDDGLPGALVTTWSQVSGPSTAAIASPGSVDTTVTFPIAGEYVLRLTADDGEWFASDTVTVTVSGSGAISSADVLVAAGSDDAEERTTGGVTLTSTDLDMVVDSGSAPVATMAAVGMRFNGVPVPPGAQITSAYLQFTSDEIGSTATSLTIRAEASDNATTYAATTRNITTRPTTSAAVGWSPGPWATTIEAALVERTPDIASVVQEVVSRPGWATGNSLALVVGGSAPGERVAYAFEGGPARAPRLHVEWTLPTTNTAPSVTVTGGPGSYEVGQPVTLTATAADAEQGDLSGSVVWRSNLDDTLGTGSSVTTSSLSVGVHTITASVTDAGGLEGSASITVEVTGGANAAPTADAGADQAITLPAAAALDGSATDDGLPTGSTLTTTWSKQSGPGTVTFADAGALATTATFGTAGSYTLRLTVTDGILTTTDDVIVTVTAANAAPTVNAGADQAVVLPATAALAGTATDDGLPTGSALTTTWSKQAGPGTVTFANANALATTAAFGAAGSYTLRLTATDGTLTTADDVIVTVTSDVIFADGFETGLTPWATTGTGLTAVAAAALEGALGLQVAITSNTARYVTDTRPTAESRYRMRVGFDPNSITMSNGNQFQLVTGRTSGTAVPFQVEMRRSGGSYQVRVGVLSNLGLTTNSAWFTITDAAHSIELDWRASTSTLVGNGSLTLWIDGTQRASLTGVLNSSHRIESLRLGAVGGIDNGTRGSLWLDRFVSTRTVAIGG